MTSFENKVALVTGAASGIGEATAVAFAQAGASVIVADFSTEAGEAVVEAIREKGGTASFVKCDVRSEADIENMVEEAVRLYGRLDCAYNNAGVGGMFAPMIEHTNEAWDLVIDTDLRGVWMSMKYEIRQMLKQGGGAIVNCASTCGLVGYKGMSTYVAAKHGVVGLTKAAALDYATQNIRVNAVCPGAIMTPATDMRNMISDPAEREALIAANVANQPIGRMGDPSEVAEAVLWLCSPGASLMLGHALAVDGAFLAQ